MTGIFSEKRRLDIAKRIKHDIEHSFPGYVIKSVVIESDGEWTINVDTEKSLSNFYHLYPNLSEAEADDQIIVDVMCIVDRHFPGANLLDYDQHAHDGFRHVELR